MVETADRLFSDFSCPVFQAQVTNTLEKLRFASETLTVFMRLTRVLTGSAVKLTGREIRVHSVKDGGGREL